jgi:hypothetical protein
MHKIYNTIIIFINNNTIINNNYGRLQDHILFFKIPIGRRKHFFHICRQFGHAPSKSFASPGLVQQQDSGGGYNRKSSSYLLLLLLCLLFLLSHNSFRGKIQSSIRHNITHRTVPFGTRVSLYSGL